MITKVTKDNKGLYKTLFAEAGEALGQGIDAITSLDDYFACFKSLAQLDQVYTVLPMDEPTFDIDADSRVITVPPEFKKNGISVQGDQVAEILYFTIDRYFDTTDLYDDEIHIVIQWEAAANGKNSDKGVSLAVLKDVTKFRDQGKMLIGWAINNKITETAGTIKFSVRFYRVQNDELTFSLSTLTQTAVINPGLNYDIDTVNNMFTDVETCDDALMIQNRYKDSVYNAGADAAHTPVFDDNMVSDTTPKKTIDGKDYYFVDLNAEGLYGFTVKASSDDAGVITYEWYHKPFGGAETSLDSEAETTYLESSDTTFDGSKVYYTCETVNGVDSYKVYSFVAGADVPEGVTLYEMFSAYTASSTGDYHVVAKNRRGIKSATLDSYTVRIPGPAALVLTYPEGQEMTLLDEEGKATLSATGDTEQTGDKVTYTWSAEGMEDDKRENQIKGVVNKFEVPAVAEEDRALFDKTYTLAAYASRNKDNTDIQYEQFRVTDAAHQLIVSPNGTQFDIKANGTVNISVAVDVSKVVSDRITYQWYRVVLSDEEDVNNPENDLAYGEAAEAAYNKDTKVCGDIHAIANAAGSYYCVVTNHVNGTTADVVSEVIRISPV